MLTKVKLTLSHNGLVCGRVKVTKQLHKKEYPVFIGHYVRNACYSNVSVLRKSLQFQLLQYRIMTGIILQIL